MHVRYSQLRSSSKWGSFKGFLLKTMAVLAIEVVVVPVNSPFIQ